MAYTNQALDHLLEPVIEGITQKVVRLGSRSKSEIIKPYMLREIEQSMPDSTLKRDVGRQWKILSDLGQEFEGNVKKSISKSVYGDGLHVFLREEMPEFYRALRQKPCWVDLALREASTWQRQGQSARQSEFECLFRFWGEAGDLSLLDQVYRQISSNENLAQTQPSSNIKVTNNFEVLSDESKWEVPDHLGPMFDGLKASAAPEDEDPDAADQDREEERDSTALKRTLIAQHFPGQDSLPAMPQNDRPLAQLIEEADFDVWQFSRRERKRLAAAIQKHALDAQRRGAAPVLQKLLDREYIQRKPEALRSDICTENEAAAKRFEELQQQSRIRVLENTDIIACTTNGMQPIIWCYVSPILIPIQVVPI